MSSNVGLSTPRGSGTSGYVQKNNAFLRPRNNGSGAPYPPPGTGANKFPYSDAGGFKQRQPDKAILEHEMKREVEVKVLEERERLEDENERIEEDGDKEGKVLSEEEIEERCEELRKRLVKDMEEGRNTGKAGERRRRTGIKAHQVHELAEAKIRESERLRKALGIRDDGEMEKEREKERDINGGGGGGGGGARGEVERRREKERERERERV
ncbi:hypothetical protein BDV12DRAFT_162946 [Aspergillus spectabilis]